DCAAMCRCRGGRARGRLGNLQGRSGRLRRQHLRAQGAAGMSDRAVQTLLPFGGVAADDEADGAETSAFPLDPERAEPLAEPAGRAPAPAASELIEPGRALALGDFVPPGITAGERLVRLAYRLGMTGHSLSA